MNHVERFRAVMDFQPVDRLPRVGMGHVVGPDDRALEAARFAAGIGELSLTSPSTSVSIRTSSSGSLPPMTRSRPCSTMSKASCRTWMITCGCARSSSRTTAERLNPCAPWAARQARGEVVVWITLEGYFWFPRTLMGFTKISLAFYDQPELLHQINQDLTDFNLRILDEVEQVCVPTFATIAEDMSYNNGPMISERHFDEFIAPYYRQIIPRLQEKNVIPIVDTDGDVTLMVPWLLREGIRGVLPLERQAGVDGMDLRRAFPQRVPGRPLQQDDHGQR